MTTKIRGFKGKNNGIGISVPKDADVEITDAELTDNGKGLEVRDEINPENGPKETKEPQQILTPQPIKTHLLRDIFIGVLVAVVAGLISYMIKKVLSIL